ncbi:helix-turn-helix domain-containing protein [Lentzea sp. NPDC058436]|uniref:helix-turn-helix domain-containing protein n=1 Tax=Lentzea sp. NPDC058436 TaxID=3346499 RepID=UPI00365471A7
MSEDWAAVAKAINQRVEELGMRQKELAERSHVSLAIVRELQHNLVERRRSPRTLESLSTALGWHPQHLEAVLHDRRPPEVGDPVVDLADTLWTRIDRVEERLEDITDRLEALKTDVASVMTQLADVAKHVRDRR